MILDSELVNHFKVEAFVAPTYTIQQKTISDPAEGIPGTVKREYWQVVRPIGAGAFGQVVLQQKNGDQVRVVKSIARRRHGQSKDLDLSRELLAMASFAKDNPYFVTLKCWFETDISVFIAMEYVEHGDLQQCVYGSLAEKETCDITRQIAQGLQHLHSQSFTHRDIKPTNILVASKAPSWWVKIGDFGISKQVHADETALRTMMTGDYVAPEVLAPDIQAILYGDDNASQDYTNAVDIWSLGCIAHWLLTFSTPFPNGTGLLLYCAGKTTFPRIALDMANPSAECINFIQCLIARFPWDRLTASQALNSTWLSQSTSTRSTIPTSNPPSPSPRPISSASVRSPLPRIEPQITSAIRNRLQNELYTQYQALQQQESELRARLASHRSSISPQPYESWRNPLVYMNLPTSSEFSPAVTSPPYVGSSQGMSPFSPYAHPIPYGYRAPLSEAHSGGNSQMEHAFQRPPSTLTPTMRDRPATVPPPVDNTGLSSPPFVLPGKRKPIAIKFPDGRAWSKQPNTEFTPTVKEVPLQSTIVRTDSDIGPTPSLGSPNLKALYNEVARIGPRASKGGVTKLTGSSPPYSREDRADQTQKLKRFSASLTLKEDRSTIIAVNERGHDPAAATGSLDADTSTTSSAFAAHGALKDVNDSKPSSQVMPVQSSVRSRNRRSHSNQAKRKDSQINAERPGKNQEMPVTPSMHTKDEPKGVGKHVAFTDDSADGWTEVKKINRNRKPRQ